MPKMNCPVCERGLETPPNTSDYRNRKSFECPRCGNFEIADMALERCLPSMDKEERKKLSAWIRTMRPVGFTITNDNLEEIRKNFPNYSVSEQQLRLLRHLEGLTSYPGHQVLVDLNDDYPVIWAQNSEELEFHLDELARREFVVKIDPSIRRFGGVSLK